MNKTWENKYIKYKLKYLELKQRKFNNQLGGAIKNWTIIFDVDESLGFFYPGLKLFKHLSNHFNKFNDNIKKVFITYFIKNSNCTRPYLSELFEFVNHYKNEGKIDRVYIFSKNHEPEWILFLASCFEFYFKIKFDKVFIRDELLNDQKHSGLFNDSKTIVIDDNVTKVNYNPDINYNRINVSVYNPSMLAINYLKLADDLLKNFPNVFSEISSKYYVRLLVDPTLYRTKSIESDDSLLTVIEQLSDLLNVPQEIQIKSVSKLKPDLPEYRINFEEDFSKFVVHTLHNHPGDNIFDPEELGKLENFKSKHLDDIFINDKYAYTVIISQILFMCMTISAKSNTDDTLIKEYMKDLDETRYKIIPFNYEIFDDFNKFLNKMLNIKFKTMGFDYHREIQEDLNKDQLLFNFDYDCDGLCKPVKMWKLEKYVNRNLGKSSSKILEIIEDLKIKYQKLKELYGEDSDDYANKKEVKKQIDEVLVKLNQENEIRSYDGSTLKGWRWIYEAYELATKLGKEDKSVVVRNIPLDKIQFGHIYVENKGDNYLPIDNARILIKNPDFFNKLMHEEYKIPPLRIYKLRNSDEYMTYDHRRLIAYNLAGVKTIDSIVDNFMWDIRENSYGPERCVYSKNDKMLLVLFPNKDITVNGDTINQRQKYGNFAVVIGDVNDHVDLGKMDFNINMLHWPCKNIKEINSTEHPLIIDDGFNKELQKEVKKYITSFSLKNGTVK
jgi:hypothetical protein